MCFSSAKKKHQTTTRYMCDTDSTETFVAKQMASSSSTVSLTLFQKWYISLREC